MLENDIQTALSAATAIFTVLDLNVHLCRDVIILVRVMSVLFIFFGMINPKVNIEKRFTCMLT